MRDTSNTVQNEEAAKMIMFERAIRVKGCR